MVRELPDEGLQGGGEWVQGQGCRCARSRNSALSAHHHVPRPCSLSTLAQPAFLLASWRSYSFPLHSFRHVVHPLLTLFVAAALTGWRW